MYGIDISQRESRGQNKLLANTRGQRQRLWKENRRENLPDGSRSP